MKFLLAFILLSIFPFHGFAICNDGRVGISVSLHDETSDKAYTNGEAVFASGDEVRVYEYENGEISNVEIFEYGHLVDDTAGNYTIYASADSFDWDSNLKAPASSLMFLHDHETWDSDGLYGWYINKDGKEFDLSSLVCPSYEIFI